MTAEDADATREVARTAREQVCSRGDMTLASRCYAEDFADHVGSPGALSARRRYTGSVR